MIRCQICKMSLKQINYGHLKTHGITTKEYKKRYNPKHLQCKLMREATSKQMIEEWDGNIRRKEEMSKRMDGNKHVEGCRWGRSEEWKEDKRIRMNKMYEDGTLKPGMGGYCKRYKVRNYIGKTKIVQGELEVRFVKMLNKLGIRWRRPKPKTYVLDDKEHKYFCDFYLPDYRMYVEVKSRYVYNNSREKVKAKKQMMIEKGERKGFRYKMMFEKNIKEFELNVIDVVDTLIERRE